MGSQRVRHNWVTFTFTFLSLLVYYPELRVGDGVDLLSSTWLFHWKWIWLQYPLEHWMNNPQNRYSSFHSNPISGSRSLWERSEEIIAMYIYYDFAGASFWTSLFFSQWVWVWKLDIVQSIITFVRMIVLSLLIITLNLFLILQIKYFSCWYPFSLPLWMPHSLNLAYNFLNIRPPGCSSNHATYCIDNNCAHLAFEYKILQLGLYSLQSESFRDLLCYILMSLLEEWLFLPSALTCNREAWLNLLLMLVLFSLVCSFCSSSALLWDLVI